MLLGYAAIFPEIQNELAIRTKVLISDDQVPLISVAHYNHKYNSVPNE